MITRNEIEALIEKLADKMLSLGCKYIYKNEIRTFVDSDHYKNAEVVVREKIDVPNIKILGHPIMIGDVLAKMKEKYSLSVCKMLLNFWEPCGLDKSLQQIFDDSGWEEVEEVKTNHARATYQPISRVKVERLRSKEAQSLGEYLLTIFKK